MKRIILAATAVAAVSSPLAVAVAPADAATNPPCASRAEFRTVHNGMTIDRVKRIVGSIGKQTIYFPPMFGDPAEQSRDTHQCGGYGFISLDYKRANGTWIVKSKSAFWM
jgi:hypothetical protein